MIFDLYGSMEFPLVSCQIASSWIECACVFIRLFQIDWSSSRQSARMRIVCLSMVRSVWTLSNSKFVHFKHIGLLLIWWVNYSKLSIDKYLLMFDWTSDHLYGHSTFLAFGLASRLAAHMQKVTLQTVSFDSIWFHFVQRTDWTKLPLHRSFQLKTLDIQALVIVKFEILPTSAQ